MLGLDNTVDNKLPNGDNKTYSESGLSMTLPLSRATSFPSTTLDTPGPERVYRDFLEQPVERMYDSMAQAIQRFDRLHQLSWGGK